MVPARKKKMAGSLVLDPLLSGSQVNIYPRETAQPVPEMEKQRANSHAANKGTKELERSNQERCKETRK